MFYKNVVLFMVVISCAGCAQITSSLKYPLIGKERNLIIGKEYKVLKDFKIVKSVDELWVYYARPTSSSDVSIADIPAGSTIKIVGASKSYVAGFTIFSYRAKLEEKKMFSKRFGLNSLLVNTDPQDLKADERYLVELQKNKVMSLDTNVQ